MRNLICWIVVFHVLLMCSPEKSYGYEGETFGSKSEIELEYLIPVEKVREIDTLSLNILKENSHDDRLSFYRGVTITRAWGNSIHLGVTRDSSAFGIGPVYLMRYQLLQNNWSTLSFDMSGGLIFYNEDFPAGGDFYNFMWRIGPKFTCQIDDNLLLNIGYKLMHVSNGQWSGSSETSHNPAYNAGGFSLSITRLF